MKSSFLFIGKTDTFILFNKSYNNFNSIHFSNSIANGIETFKLLNSSIQIIFIEIEKHVENHINLIQKLKSINYRVEIILIISKERKSITNNKKILQHLPQIYKPLNKYKIKDTINDILESIKILNNTPCINKPILEELHNIHYQNMKANLVPMY